MVMGAGLRSQPYFFEKLFNLLKACWIFATNSRPSNSTLKKNKTSPAIINPVDIAATAERDKSKNGSAAIAIHATNDNTKRQYPAALRIIHSRYKY